MITLLIIFFIGIFAWQIEKYLLVSQDTKLQAEISKLNLIIEAENMAAFNIHKYAYLHQEDNIAEPLSTKNLKTNFEPVSTLVNLFIKNGIYPKGATKESCYLYIYFPPGEASEIFDFYEDRDPGYIAAGWSRFEAKPIVSASTGLTAWAESNLKESDFYCDSKSLSPDKLAVDGNGSILDLPGINFQFSGLNFSKVKL
ncbi:hypothetical protein GW756_01965 [bacterium]|nr:hypothetical protein [bacterium]NCQ55559.1 hypothetical protein [Candidatus Parcubacteria bacterium]NCS67384.1 hypothetical protein [Candidatus Peregrinibacteria bacterium]NCS96110.1 hypothetical protein [bacterium]